MMIDNDNNSLVNINYNSAFKEEENLNSVNSSIGKLINSEKVADINFDLNNDMHKIVSDTLKSLINTKNKPNSDNYINNQQNFNGNYINEINNNNNLVLNNHHREGINSQLNNSKFAIKTIVNNKEFQSGRDNKPNNSYNKINRVNTLHGKLPCNFYRSGACNKGDNCTFSHNIEQDRPKVSTYY
jgi:hypothetical protein